MNYNIAKAQKIGMHHDVDNVNKVKKQLQDNKYKSSKVNEIPQLDRVKNYQDEQGLNEH